MLVSRISLFALTLSLGLIVSLGCESDDDATQDTSTPADTVSPEDTATPADTATPVDTVAPDTVEDTAVAPDTDSELDTESDAAGDVQAADTLATDTVTADSSGAAGACDPSNNGDDCGWCTYSQPVASVDDCYCTACPSHALSKTSCDVFSTQYQAQCPPGWDSESACPVPRCVNLPETACDPATDLCVNSCDLVTCEVLDCNVADYIYTPGGCCPTCPADPNACEGDDDCQRCSYSKPVTTTTDCYCPICPTHATSTDACTDFGAQWQNVCAGDWAANNPCPAAICLRPDAVACGDSGVCGGCGDTTCQNLDCPADRQFTAEGECCPQCAPEPDDCSGDGAGDCKWCTYHRGVDDVSECYCTFCPSFGVTTSQCDQWQSEWQTQCGSGWPGLNQCPTTSCAQPQGIVCEASGACVEAPDIMQEEPGAPGQ